MFTYPDARRTDVSDDYHGSVVADPYRWLEDPESAETKAFVEAQNALTMPYLAGLAGRDRLVDRMTELWDTPRSDPPMIRNQVAIWTHNDGLQDQPVFLVRRPGAEPKVLLDPNGLSDDGAVAVTVWSLSPDGALFAYALSEAGSDRQHLRIRTTDTGQDLDDRLDHLRFTSIAWHKDGFFYTRWPETDPDSTDPVRDPSVHFHRVGDPQSVDRLVFHNDDDPEPGYAPSVTEDDRYLLLIEYLGTSNDNGLLYLDLTAHGAAITAPETETEHETQPAPADSDLWQRLIPLGVAMHNPVLHHDGGLVVHTNRDAPNGAIVQLPLGAGEDPPARTVIAEGETAIEAVGAVAGELLVLRLAEAAHQVERWSIDGSRIGDVDLPAFSSVYGLTGRFADRDAHIGYQSFVTPPQVLRWDRDGSEVVAGSPAPIDANSVVIERRHATSSDGRQVGMFVIRLAETPLPAPVEMYGYGGFSINLTPAYSPARLAFLEAGGVVAVTNLRGGVELGESWHEQGMLGNKQQVFDDFIACGEALIDQGVTTAGQLGVRGGSNGGLLTATVMVQRPDLFGAVVSQVPVTDMLRFQHFTAGRFWTVEYGDAANADDFDWLIAYSPLHNVADADTYPPLLITTAESDDRVVPMHSHKLAATVQHAAGGRSERPLLLRVETRAGHGAGKPTAKLIEESADIYSFLLANLTE